MPFLEKELKELMNEHNAYSIRKQKDRLCPPGVPEDNFLFPDRKGKEIELCIFAMSQLHYSYIKRLCRAKIDIQQVCLKNERQKYLYRPTKVFAQI